MKILPIFFFLTLSLSALQTSDKLFECTEIFKERKSELLVELERIDEQKQALSALKTATENLLKKKEAKLKEQEKRVEEKLQKLDAQKKSYRRVNC